MDDPAARGARHRSGSLGLLGRLPAVVPPGLLSLLVSAVLLVPLPPMAALVAVGVLVAALAALALPAARASSGWSTTLPGQVLWFWGVVTGLGHLLRALVTDRAGIQSVAIGAAVTLVWAACLAVLRATRAR